MPQYRASSPQGQYLAAIDPNRPDGDLLPSVLAMRRLLCGGEITQADLPLTSKGTRGSSLPTAVHTLQRLGYTFTSQTRWPKGPGGEPIPGPGRQPVYWQITNPAHTPDLDAPLPPPRRGIRPASSNGAVEPVKSKRRAKAPAMPTPSFGDEVRIFALVENDDGSVQIGVRDGDGGKWLAHLTGFQRVAE